MFFRMRGEERTFSGLLSIRPTRSSKKSPSGARSSTSAVVVVRDEENPQQEKPRLLDESEVSKCLTGNGAGDGIRTHDLLHGKQMLCH